MDISLVREFRYFLLKIIEAMTNPAFAKNVIQVSVEKPYRDACTLNFVQTRDTNDVFYTTLFEMDEKVYEALLKREMGNQTAEKWKRKEPIPDTSYRPIKLTAHMEKSKDLSYLRKAAN